PAAERGDAELAAATRTKAPVAVVEPTPAAPAGSSDATAALRSARALPDDRRAAWGPLARTLDESCAAGGCHRAAAIVDFRATAVGEAAVPQFGRWERNLIAVRARATLNAKGGGDAGGGAAAAYALGAFGTVKPHDLEMDIALAGEEAAAIDWLYRAPGRLLGPDGPPPRYEELARVPGDSLRRARRAWLALYGRAPALAELLPALETGPREWLAAARRTPEHWEQRARATLRAAAGYDSEGGFSLAGALEGGVLAAEPAAWRRQVIALAAKFGDAGPGAAGARTFSRPPLPAEDGSDDRYDAWFFESLNDPPRTLPADVLLRSTWCALWNRAPAPHEDECFYELAASELGWHALREPLVSFLARAPRVPLRPHEHAAVLDWVAGFGKWILGRDLDAEACAAIAERIAGGTLDYRLFVEECLLAEEWGRDG
ncbi:MAG: hypothetical protein L0Z55_05620, partial [Planctomycetes bacterium]|nr:hypothetical protein [Planctomycetota bacterium]